MEQVPIARVVLTSPGQWSNTGRKDLAAWLRKQADSLEHNDDQYTNGRFTARYLAKPCP